MKTERVMKTQPEAPNCERQEELIDYLYDEMSVAQRALFTDHLQACASCRTDLGGMQQLRGELRNWDLGVVPRLELVMPRPRLEVLKELLGLFPVWSRALLATASAVALVLLALGTASLFNRMSAPETVAQQPPAPAPAPVAVAVIPPVAAQAALTPELKQFINSEVTKAVEAERQVLQAQLAALDARNQAQRAQLQAVSRQLRDLNTRHQQMLAAQQPSLRSIFAEYEPGSER
jgi:hypothetical protein